MGECNEQTKRILFNFVTKDQSTFSNIKDDTGQCCAVWMDVALPQSKEQNKTPVYSFYLYGAYKSSYLNQLYVISWL